MANDTMLHCALKAQPNNKARAPAHSTAHLLHLAHRVLCLLATTCDSHEISLLGFQVLLKLLIDHGAEVAAKGADQMTCEEMLLARHHKVFPSGPNV